MAAVPFYYEMKFIIQTSHGQHSHQTSWYQNSLTTPPPTQDQKCALQDEIALINQDQNVLHTVFDHFVDRLRQCTPSQGGHLQELTTINNKIAFCGH
jgi:hypothetical protein